MLKLENIRKIYFIGIGGIGMSAAAGIARAKGFEVSGSDADDVYEPSKGVLDHFNIDYKIGYNANNFKGADLVVTTAAVDEFNPEVAKAISEKVPIVSYPELLGSLVSGKKQIVVVGTHGKGSTAGLLGYVLKALNDDSFFVGAVLTDLGTNFYYGQGQNIVLEGDEYKSSHSDPTAKFLYYKPDVLVINNLEFDHPDMYVDFAAMKVSFTKLLSGLSSEATVVYNSDDANVVELVNQSSAKKLSFGFNGPVDVKGDGLRLKNSNFVFNVTSPNGNFEAETKLPGLPYAYNSLAAASTLLALGLKPDSFLHLFPQYSGVKRRFEIVKDGSITIIDDYAHHPTAVRQTLEAAVQKYPERRIVCFFEPHTYSRTKETLSELSNSFAAAGLVYIAEVYPAREQKLPSSITGQQVLDEVGKKHLNVYYVKDKADALDQYKKALKPGDVIIVMAVGSFNTLVNDLKNVG